METTKILEDAIALAKKRYDLTNGADAEAMILAYRGSEVFGLIKPDFSSDLSKDYSALAVREWVKDNGCTATALLSEAWMIVRDRDEDIFGQPPSECEDRIEVLLCEVSTPRDYLMSTYGIKRLADGTIYHLEHKNTSSATDEYHSRFDFFSDARA